MNKLLEIFSEEILIGGVSLGILGFILALKTKLLNKLLGIRPPEETEQIIEFYRQQCHIKECELSDIVEDNKRYMTKLREMEHNYDILMIKIQLLQELLFEQEAKLEKAKEIIGREIEIQVEPPN